MNSGAKLFFNPVLVNRSLNFLQEAPELAQEGGKDLLALFLSLPWIAVVSAARGLAAKMVCTFTDDVRDPIEFGKLQDEMLEALSKGQEQPD